MNIIHADTTKNNLSSTNDDEAAKNGKRMSSPSQLLTLIRIDSFPDHLLAEILDYVCITERRIVLGLNKKLWQQRNHLEETMKSLTLFSKRDGQALLSPTCLDTSLSSLTTFWNRLSNLQHLDLQNYCTDIFLQCVVQYQLFPNLTSISMVRSLEITDQGLECLSRGAPQLEHVDITFCKNTTYAGTFPLRERLLNLKLLRRQPKWLDGKFHTPFAGEQAAQTEVHTYWPDGTFTFNRDSQSNGFVCDLLDWEDDFFGDKLQYNNFVTPLGWPEWTRYCYRPGVCLWKRPAEDEEGRKEKPISGKSSSSSTTPVSTVLVGQYLRGLRPPKNKALMERADPLVPLGSSKYFDREGNLLPEMPARGDAILISKMSVYPLDSMLPPKELVDVCRSTCMGMQIYGKEFLETKELELHTLLTQDW